MAAKSVFKSSASALLALALGTAALIPASAVAQERDQRGPAARGMERSAPPAMPRPSMPAVRPAQTQAPAWQSRSPAANPQPSWAGRPTFSQGSQAPQPSRQPSANPGGWNGQPAWRGDSGRGDRERGDRGNGVNPAGQPAFGRPGGWVQGGQGGTSTPAWQDRNPGGRPNDGRPNDGRPNTGRPNDGRPADGRGQSWNQDNQGRWYHAENGTWRQDRGGQWYRDTNRGANSWRDNNGNRDRNWDRSWQQNRGNGWGYNNGWRGNDRGWGYNNDGRAWDRDGWRHDNRYDWQRWRSRNRTTFSLGLYYAPWQDYSYSRFGIGVIIGAPFYDQRYWIADPYAYRLPPAWGPYRWVRYYDDALLVDIYTGEVVDAIYDIFW
ncbi:RcnB family protein [Novosphingobium fuchskuhlense]|nr:RcnB family protein [Novosphingobium fuchskuhlense]